MISHKKVECWEIHIPLTNNNTLILFAALPDVERLFTESRLILKEVAQKKLREMELTEGKG